MIGWFVNSYYNDTFIAAKRFNYKYKSLEYGVIAGVSYGYYCDELVVCFNRFSPVMAPYVSYAEYRMQPTVSIMGAAVFLTLKITY